MAVKIADLAIKLGVATADLERGFKIAAAEAQKFSGSIDNIGAGGAGGGLAGMLPSLKSIGLAAAAAGAAFAGWGVKLAAESQTAAISFKVLLGSAEEAQQVLGALKQFAAETPFEFPELREAGQKLIAFGTGSEELIPTLRALGDVASGMGIPLTELSEIYGKARVQGRLFMEDINQMTGRGIPFIKELASQFGVTEAEVRKMVETGQVGFDNLRQAFADMTGEGGMFAGMMEEQSRTLAGRWSTLKDSVAQLADSLGQMLVPAMEKLVESGIKLTEWLKSFDAAQAKNVVTLTAFVAGFAAAVAIIPKLISGIEAIVKALRSMATASAIAQSLSGPKGWATLAAGLVVAAGSAVAVNALFTDSLGDVQVASEQLAGQQKTLADFTNQATEATAAATEQQQEMARQLEALQRQGDSLEQSLRSPFEKFGDDLRDFNQLLDVGAINWETYQRAVAKAEAELLRATEIKTNFDRLQTPQVGAATRFSSEGFSAVIAARNEQVRQLEVQRQQLEQQKKQAELLRRIYEELANADDPITVKEVTL